MARRASTNNTTKAEIVQTGIHLMLEKGYKNSTIKELSEILGISKGNITFYFPTKEHLLLELTNEVLEFHQKCIERVRSDGYTDLLAYCWEIAAQIVICEDYEKMRELYLEIYTHQMTMARVKYWTAEKNYKLLHPRLPDWTPEKFRIYENVACCIERSALTELCTAEYPLETKVVITLDSLLKLYDVEKETRMSMINQILDLNYHKIGRTLHEEFITFVENVNRQALERALHITKS